MVDIQSTIVTGIFKYVNKVLDKFSWKVENIQFCSLVKWHCNGNDVTFLK